jgi:CRP/FNR family transcriptional regulator
MNMIQTDVEVRVDQFFSQFHLHIYKKGELILQPDQTNGVFFLKNGNVRVYGISPQGIEVGIHIFVPNTYFPMTWVISDIPNRYYYEALTDVQIYQAPKEAVLSFLKKNVDVFFDLTKRIISGLDRLVARVEYLSYGKAHEKVVSVILYLARHFGVEKNNTVTIKHIFTHRDIGSLAGITRETTSREWEKLEEKGIISYRNQSIRIHDLLKLKKELSG